MVTVISISTVTIDNRICILICQVIYKCHKSVETFVYFSSGKIKAGTHPWEHGPYIINYLQWVASLPYFTRTPSKYGLKPIARLYSLKSNLQQI